MVPSQPVVEAHLPPAPAPKSTPLPALGDMPLLLGTAHSLLQFGAGLALKTEPGGSWGGVAVSEHRVSTLVTKTFENRELRKRPMCPNHAYRFPGGPCVTAACPCIQRPNQEAPLPGPQNCCLLLTWQRCSHTRPHYTREARRSPVPGLRKRKPVDQRGHRPWRSRWAERAEARIPGTGLWET